MCDHGNSSNFEAWLTSTLLSNRWGAHYFSNLLTIVPTDEARLRNNGLIPFYNLIGSIDKALKTIADKKQITPPPYPDIPANWTDEAAIDIETLRAALPPTPAPGVELLEFTEKLMSKNEYHWGSLVAFISAGADAYLDPKAAKKTPAGDDSLAPFFKAMRDGGMAEISKVIREELSRCGDEATETGWREEEAKELKIEHLRLLNEYWEAL